MVKPVAIIEGFPHKWQIDFIKQLDLDPKLWISNDLNNLDQLPGGCVFQSAEELISWKSSDKVQTELEVNKTIEYRDDAEIFSDAGEIDKICRVIRIRRDLYGKKLLLNEGLLRRRVYKQIAYWYQIIENLRPEIVVFEAAPHLVHHYTLYYAAKKSNLKTIIFSRIGEPLRIMVSNEITDLYPDRLVNNEAIADKVEAIRNKPKYAVDGPSAAINLNRILSIAKDKPLRAFRPSTYKWLLRVTKDLVYKIPYTWIYNYYCLKQLPDNKFIYFPLHESPEDTTYPSGWNFEDQIYAIEYLSQLIPKSITIAVKEHPNQRYWRGRYLSFYRELSEIDSVVLLHQSIESFSILDKCSIVATITGQAGWEALTNSKKVIYFGDAWYKGAPGSIDIGSFKKMTKKKRDEFMSVSGVVGLQNWYDNLFKRSFSGYVNNIVSDEQKTKSDLPQSINKMLCKELLKFNDCL
jgi:hypothetical protein